MGTENQISVEEQNTENIMEQAAVADGLVDPSLDSPEDIKPDEKPADEAKPDEKPEDKPDEKPADEGKPEKTLLETVRERDAELQAKQLEKVTAEEKKEEKPAAQADDQKPADKEQKPDDEKDDRAGKISSTEWKTLPKNVKQRIGNLYRETKEAQERIAELEPSSALLADLSGYIRDSGMSQEEFQEGLQLMRLRHMDPKAALTGLIQIVDELKVSVGETLPNDLQEAVDDGRIGELEAKELAGARADKARMELQTRTPVREEETPAAREEVAKITEQHKKTHSAVIQMEKTWVKTDPDYAAKRSAILERLEWLFTNKGVPQDHQEMLDLVAGAKKTVDDRMTRRGTLKEKIPVDIPNNPAGTKPVAKTALEQCKIDEQARIAEASA